MNRVCKNTTAIAMAVSLSLAGAPAAAYAQEETSVQAAGTENLQTEESAAAAEKTGFSEMISEEISQSRVGMPAEDGEENPAGTEEISAEEAGTAETESRKDEDAAHADNGEKAAEEETISSESDTADAEAASAGEDDSAQITISETGSSREVTLTMKEKPSGVKVAVWSAEGGQDDIVWYKLTEKDGKWRTDFDLTRIKHPGNVIAHFYTTQNSFIAATVFQADQSETARDTFVIKGSGASRQAEVSLDRAVPGVRVAVWTAQGGQDDLKWYKLINSSGNSWSAIIDVHSLKHAGSAYAHFYSGNTFLGAEKFTVEEEDLPKNSVAVSEKGSDRTVTAVTAKPVSGAKVAVWSKEGGQDDLKWYPMKKQPDGSWTVKISSRSLKHNGSCFAHAYTSDNKIIGTAVFTMDQEDMPKNSISVSDSGRNRKVTVFSQKKVSSVRVAVWSAEGGQDDLVWYNLKQNDEGDWVTEISGKKIRHAGTCHAHVYAGSTLITHTSFTMEENELSRDVFRVSPGSGSWQALASLEDSKIKQVRVAVWSAEGSQDDLTWYDLKKTSSGDWAGEVSVRSLHHTGTCYAHFYSGTNTFLGASSFTVSKADLNKSEITVSGSGAARRITVKTGKHSNMTAAVWSVKNGQDDLTWHSLTRQGDGSWIGDISLGDLKHSGDVNIHVYADGNSAFLGNTTVSVSASDLKKGQMITGNDSDIDYVQWAINVANNNAVGYGHTYPRTISCAGLVGLALTNCGYGDLIKDDPLGWGYIDLGAEYEEELIRMGCTVIPGVWTSSRYNELLPGDILYYYYNINSNHVGFYVGNGKTVEARGPGGARDADESGAEVAVYNWKNESLTFQKVFRLPQDKIHHIR